MMARYGMLINTKKCIGCYACRTACQRQNDLLPDESFIRFEEREVGKYPNVTVEHIPLQCMHCEDAPCVAVCPTGAAFIGADGIVGVDEGRCIGCKYCMMACPYGVRSWNTKEKAVEKCTLCGQLTSAGQEPACVAACCANARFYGDLDDPSSDVSKAVAAADPASVHTLHDAGNKPLTRYILSDKIATWHDVDAIKPASDAQDAAWFAKEA